VQCVSADGDGPRAAPPRPGPGNLAQAMGDREHALAPRGITRGAMQARDAG